MSARSLFATWVAIVLTSVLATAQAHETVLYSFGTSSNDGAAPNGGLVFDRAGNLYGTTESGGLAGCSGHCGTVFELSPANDGTWTETVLYQFCSQPNCSDGGQPRAGLVIDDLGNLYGTAGQGDIGCGVVGCGNVFELSPPALPGDSWQYTVLWSFGSAGNDGAAPYGRLNRDNLGNLYGTTAGSCCGNGAGVVFELSSSPSGTWNETILYAFCLGGPPCPDGYTPRAGVSFDALGNLYGTTFAGANDGRWGTAYKLSPQGNGTWTETTLHRFTAQGGGMPLSTVNFDLAGNLYGTVSTGEQGGPAQCGGVWRLTPRGDGFKEGALLFNPSGTNGCTPVTGVFMDAKANTVVGTTSTGGTFHGGTIFKITDTKLTVVYNFCQQAACADGSTPTGSFTQHGNALYSTTSKGGAFNQGVVFKITP